MALDDDDYYVEAPSKVPSRVSKFAPKSSKPKPKSEPQQPKPEPHPQPPPSSKPEPHIFDSTANKKEDEDDTVSPPTTETKPEPNGAVKMDMDVEPKPEAVDETSQDDPMAVDEDQDPVVREIDVFFSPSIDADTKLYALQYPLRPRWRPYELDERCEEVRLKPKTSEVEVDLSVDLESGNIDREFARKINFTKQTLSTSWIPPNAKNGYAVGLLMGDKLHLHPLDAVVQLRPSLQHLRSSGSKRKNIISTEENAAVKFEESIEEKSVSTPKNKNKQTESSIGKKTDDDECWVPLKYHCYNSDISSRYLQQMVGHKNSPIEFTMNAYDYVTKLCPGVSSNTVQKEASTRYLLSSPLPVEERLKKLLMEGPPLHRFSAIKHFASGLSDEDLLGFLQQNAILVQGLWTVKTSFLYTGVEKLARDFVLLLFSKKLKVQSSDVNVKGDLGNHMKNFLKIFGLEKTDPCKSSAQPNPYWKFRELPDVSFKKNYSNIVEEQEKIFQRIEKEIYDVVYAKRKLGKDALAKRSVSADSKLLVRSVGGLPLEKTTMSNEARLALPAALKKLFQAHKVCSFQMIRQGLRELAVSKSIQSKGDSKTVVDAAHCLDCPQEELKALVHEFACEIHGNYVPKSSSEDKFRELVIRLLRERGADAKLKKAEIFEAARKELSREATNSEYNRVMNELCVSRGSFWVFRSGDGSSQ